MTTAEKNALGDLVCAMTQAEIRLTQKQQEVGEAMDARDQARRAYYDLVNSIPVSDAPAEVKPKRKYERKVTAPGPAERAMSHLYSAPNAALSGTQGDQK